MDWDNHRGTGRTHRMLEAAGRYQYEAYTKGKSYTIVIVVRFKEQVENLQKIYWESMKIAFNNPRKILQEYVYWFTWEEGEQYIRLLGDQEVFILPFGYSGTLEKAIPCFIDHTALEVRYGPVLAAWNRYEAGNRVRDPRSVKPPYSDGLDEEKQRALTQQILETPITSLRPGRVFYQPEFPEDYRMDNFSRRFNSY